MDQVTNPENNLLLTTVRKFLEKEIRPNEEEVDEIGEAIRELGMQIETRSKEV